jgi:nitroreductase
MTAAQLRIDTCPMGGFDQVQMDKVLHLGEKGLASVALCAIGYRGDDAYASAPKSRLSADEVVVTLGVK